MKRNGRGMTYLMLEELWGIIYKYALMVLVFSIFIIWIICKITPIIFEYLKKKF